MDYLLPEFTHLFVIFMNNNYCMFINITKNCEVIHSPPAGRVSYMPQGTHDTLIARRRHVKNQLAVTCPVGKEAVVGVDFTEAATTVELAVVV